LCDPISPIYQAADLFVLPSYKEGFSNALIEAMASGLPVVATDAGGNAEALAGEQGGIIVPPGDVDRLEAAVASLLGDPLRRAALARSARPRAERFSLDRMVSEVESLYLELAG